MNPKLILCLAFALSYSLTGCVAMKHSDTDRPSKGNASNYLVPIFDKAAPILNLNRYAFLTNALDEDPKVSPQLTKVFQLDLGLHIGPLLMVEYETHSAEAASRALAFFKGDLSQGYNLILPNLCLFYDSHGSDPEESGSVNVYVGDADGDGHYELLYFSIEKKGELLDGIYGYDESLGIFARFDPDPLEGVKAKSTFRILAPLTPKEYLRLRRQGPIDRDQLGGGSYSDYDIQQSKKLFKP